MLHLYWYDSQREQRLQSCSISNPASTIKGLKTAGITKIQARVIKRKWESPKTIGVKSG